jgi:predicted acyltransferase
MATVVGAPPETFRRVPVEPAPSKKETSSDRLMSLDAFRGFIMTVLAAHGFGLDTLMGDPNWGWLGRQFEHVRWEGMMFWDTIQPSFMFMVGLAMPFAFAARARRGGQEAVWRHTAYRALMLIVISNVLMSVSAGRLHFQLINVLAQIGFTYFICYFIMKLPFKGQVLTAALIMEGYTALFIAFPGSGGPYSMGDNIGERIDQFFFGRSNPGHWANINFIPSTVVTLLGVWCGYLMIEKNSHARRMKILAAGAAGLLLAGYGLSPVIPIIKRIHTTAFTFASLGCVLLMLLAFYWLVEVRGYRKLTFPLVVVGMNSIFIYCFDGALYSWLDRAVGVFTGGYELLGKCGPIAQAVSVFLVMWYLCYWLYQRRIFVKI